MAAGHWEVMALHKKDREGTDFFTALCENYYENILRYLFATLREESAARDCTQEVFLVALQKSALLAQHPNPGGFLFQTAKNLAQKTRRESFRTLCTEAALDAGGEPADAGAAIETALDRQINELDYIDDVLSRLSEERQNLYALYYLAKKPMAEIAEMLGLKEPALRMRYVRLRREIRAIAAAVAEEHFSS